jgi:hypothetical protein
MKYFLNILLLSGLLFSCKSPEKKEKLISVDNLKNELSNREIVNTFYNVPSPSEQFELLSNLDGVKNFDLLYPIEKKEKHITNFQKNLAFGIYTADAAYLASYKNKIQLVNYLSILDVMAQDMGLSAVLSSEMATMFKDKNTSMDSLFKIADQLYLRSFDRLIENQKGEDLCIILYSAWVETMHLGLNSSKGYGKSPRIDKYLASQKLISENLLSFMLDYQTNENVVTAAEKLGNVLSLFDGMNCKYEETKVKSEKNILSISGGTKCTMNQEVFTSLKDKIEELRNKMIQ